MFGGGVEQHKLENWVQFCFWFQSVNPISKLYSKPEENRDSTEKDVISVYIFNQKF